MKVKDGQDSRATQAPKPAPDVDCRTCGACCSGELDDGEGFADVTIADVKRMSRHARARLAVVGGRGSDAHLQTPAVYHRIHGKSCGFLRGTPGQRVSCGIYESRPDVCRRFSPGGSSCRTAREEIEIREPQ